MYLVLAHGPWTCVGCAVPRLRVGLAKCRQSDSPIVRSSAATIPRRPSRSADRAGRPARSADRDGRRGIVAADERTIGESDCRHLASPTRKRGTAHPTQVHGPWASTRYIVPRLRVGLASERDSHAATLYM